MAGPLTRAVDPQLPVTPHPNAKSQITRPRAVTYVRSATVSRRGKHAVVRDQRRQCDELATKLGAEAVEIYEDLGKSGNDVHRPGLKALLERVDQQPKVDYVITRDRNRLSRNTRDDVTLHDRIERTGARVVTTDRAPLHDFLQTLSAIVAELDSRERSERARAAWARRR